MIAHAWNELAFSAIFHGETIFLKKSFPKIESQMG